MEIETIFISIGAVLIFLMFLRVSYNWYYGYRVVLIDGQVHRLYVGNRNENNMIYNNNPAVATEVLIAETPIVSPVVLVH